MVRKCLELEMQVPENKKIKLILSYYSDRFCRKINCMSAVLFDYNKRRMTYFAVAISFYKFSKRFLHVWLNVVKKTFLKILSIF